MFKSGVKQGVLGAMLLGIALEASAVPITGEIGFGGNFIPVDSNWAQTGTASATGIDFDPNYIIVTNATGSFSGASMLGTIEDFQFDPTLGVNDGFGGITTVASITDFWTVDSFSFELTSVARGSTNDPDKFLVLEGSGIITRTGFEATSGTWIFTGDTSNGGTFSWSAGSAAMAVPEPGTLALLGFGLLFGAGTLRIRSEKCSGPDARDAIA